MPALDPTILLVDDDKPYVTQIRSLLETEGYRVICAYDGFQAISMAQRHKPTVVLLDITLPYLDGLNVFHRLRSNPQTARIPVIFVSAIASQVIYPILEHAPRTAHVKKPFDHSDLLSLLREFCHIYAV